MPTYKGTNKIVGAYKGNTELSSIYKGLSLVYTKSNVSGVTGVPPLTLTNALAGNLVNYQIYGNSTQTGTPTYTSPIDINSLGIGKGALPDGYSQVDYLIGTGDEYIDTGYSPNNNSKMWLDYQPLSAQNRMYAGARSTSTNRYFTINSGSSATAMLASWGSTNNYKVGDMSTARHQTTIGPDGIYYDGVLKTTPSQLTWSLNEHVALFGVYQNGESSASLLAEAYIYGAKIWENDVLVRDFIPCYRNSDWRAGFYDIVNDVFYTNASSSSADFMPGPDSSIVPVSYDVPVSVNGVDTNISLSSPLRKVGNYSDYIDYVNQRVVRNVGVKMLNGSENWEIHSVPGRTFRLDGAFEDMANGQSIWDCGFCTHLSITNITSTANFVESKFRFTASSPSGDPTTVITISGRRLYAKFSNDFTTIEQLRAFLVAQYQAGTPVTLIYPLNNPVYESLTIPSIVVSSGSNTVNISTTPVASSVHIKYKSTV